MPYCRGIDSDGVYQSLIDEATANAVSKMYPNQEIKFSAAPFPDITLRERPDVFWVASNSWVGFDRFIINEGLS